MAKIKSKVSKKSKSSNSDWEIIDNDLPIAKGGDLIKLNLNDYRPSFVSESTGVKRQNIQKPVPQKKQEQTIKQSERQSIPSKAAEVLLHPLTAISNYSQKGYIPDNFSKGEVNPIDYAMDVINPAFYANAGKEAVTNTGRGIYNLGAGNFSEALSDFGTAGLNALAVGAVAPFAPKAANFLTTQTPLRNTYKINPWAFKPNPEAYYHRSPNLKNIINQEKGILQGFGESEAGKMFTQKALKPFQGINLQKGANSKLYFSKGVPLDYGRTNMILDKKTGKMIPGQGYKGPYVVEVEGVPMGVSTKGRAPGAEPTRIGDYAVSKRPISLDEAKFYKEDWLRGYKQINPFKQEGGNIPIDPMGYWNPDNYNKPAVTIPSNEITMKEKNGKPLKKGKLLGIDDTGYAQMMYPGEDYIFPGDYVTEYPLPEAGGGYRVIRSNERKGKTHKVIGPDGTVKFFGDSKLGQHPKDKKRKKAFYARHKKNLAKNPYFRAFARKTWAEGGMLPDLAAMAFGGLHKAQDGFYNMQRALELGYNPDDQGHWPSVDSETGMWLKSKEHPTAWMEYLYGYTLNPEVQKNFKHPVVNPEGYFGGNQLQYIPKQAFGGNLILEKYADGGHGGLDRWFAEKWVDVKTGKPCGRQKGEKRKGYPACRPSKRVSSETPKTSSELSPSEKAKFKREKTSSKKISYQHRRKEEGGNVNDREMVEGIADILSQVDNMSNRKQIARNMLSDFKNEGVSYDYSNFLEDSGIPELKSGGNVATNSALWSKAKSMARSKFDVYPSAYANAWAAKWYKSKGGGWRKKAEGGSVWEILPEAANGIITLPPQELYSSPMTDSNQGIISEIKTRADVKKVQEEKAKKKEALDLEDKKIREREYNKLDVQSKYVESLNKKENEEKKKALNNIIFEYENADKNKVKDFQKMLISEGYNLGKYGADGKFGQFTKNALISKFQNDSLDTGLIDKYYKKFDEKNSKNVKEIQQKLFKEGYLKGNPSEEIDGKFGDKTKQALEKYNKVKDPNAFFFSNIPKKIEEEECAKGMCKVLEMNDIMTDALGVKYKDAWDIFENMNNKKNSTSVYNIYDDPKFKKVKNEEELVGLTKEIKQKNQTTPDMYKTGDVVGIFWPGSTHHAETLKSKTHNTHVGFVSSVENGVPMITHNVFGTIKTEPFTKLNTTWIQRPKQNVKFNQKYQPELKTRDNSEIIKNYEKRFNATISPERKKQLSTILNTVYTDSQNLPKLLNSNVDPEWLESAVVGITGVETGIGKNIDKSIQDKDFKNKAAYVVKGVKDENVSLGISKTKFNTLDNFSKSYFDIKSVDDLGNDEKLLHATTYNLIKYYDTFKDYALKFPEMQLTEQDIRDMSILAHNRGDKKLLTLGRRDNNPNSERYYKDSEGLNFKEEVKKLRDITRRGAIQNDKSTTLWRFLPDVVTAPMDFSSETYVSKVKNYQKDLYNKSFKNGGSVSDWEILTDINEWEII